jgi:tRNA-dihydrouridine synthase B
MLPWLAPGRFPLYLAPMAGFTDPAFRDLCKAMGADVLVTEFVRANSLLRGGKGAWFNLFFPENQRPIGTQLFGATAEEMAEAAQIVQDRLAPDFIDLNFGCPADNVTCRQAGSSLLLDLPQLERIVAATVNAVPNTPVTAKIRIGWDEAHIVAVEAAQRCEAAGAQAITVHGRTKAQGYAGDARWDVITAVAEALKIPVIGNGNVRTADDVLERKQHTGVAGIMIGRAALGYPWLFREIKHRMATGETPPPPTTEERWQTLLDYTRRLIHYSDGLISPDHIGGLHAKIKSLTKDMPGCKKLRPLIERCNTLTDLEALAKTKGEGPAPA